jgi:membrane associated rhomboid family serine protease
MNDNHFKFSPSTWIIPTLTLLFIWGIFYVDNSFRLHLNYYGILPRTFTGLQGVIFSPFLHNDLNHIANNSLPLFILILALIYFYREVSLKVLFYGVLLSGFLTWIIGRESYHIGASGLIYVLVSFIFFKGMMTQYYRLMALSLVVVVLYGGMIWYVFPEVDKTVSWEGHLAGLITGFVFAVRFKTPDYIKDIQYDWERSDFNPSEDKFLQRFDENGNFVNLPEPDSVEEVIDSNKTSSTSNYKIVYDYVKKNYTAIQEDDLN